MSSNLLARRFFNPSFFNAFHSSEDIQKLT
nr:MAG TPA: hypothetical protein [Caudoviricetes sp.]